MHAFSKGNLQGALSGLNLPACAQAVSGKARSGLRGRVLGRSVSEIGMGSVDATCSCRPTQGPARSVCCDGWRKTPMPPVQAGLAGSQAHRGAAGSAYQGSNIAQRRHGFKGRALPGFLGTIDIMTGKTRTDGSSRARPRQRLLDAWKGFCSSWCKSSERSGVAASRRCLGCHGLASSVPMRYKRM